MTETGSNVASASALTINQKGGTGTLTAGLTSVNVAHGLGAAPTRASLTPRDFDAVNLIVDWTLTDATNLVVASEFALADDADFIWEVGK